MFSYQCSQLSTTQSIHDIFETALCFQQNQNTAAFVSVVVLDEIGLAEDSPQLPLKVLHPLLEDGTGSTIKVYLINRIAHNNKKCVIVFLFCRPVHNKIELHSSGFLIGL